MATDSDRQWLTVGEFMRRHPQAGGKNLIYEKCKDGSLKSIRLGGKILVASDALELLAEISSSGSR